MCHYCKDLEEEATTLFDVNHYVTEIGQYDEATEHVDDLPILGLSCYLVSGAIEVGVTSGSETFIRKRVNINYCPFCGKELKK